MTVDHRKTVSRKAQPMAYTPINLCAYLAAYSGAISGMSVGGGWIVDPTSANYSNLTDIAGKYAEAIDQTWNNSTPLTSLEKDTIRELSVQLFVRRGAQPAAFSTFHVRTNWNAVAAGVVATTHQSDTYVAGQGVGNNQTNGQVQRARGVVTNILLPIGAAGALGITLVDPGNNDGITYALGDTVLAVGNHGEGGTPHHDGPYIIVSVAAGIGTLQRPGWWPTAAVLQTDGVPIEVGAEGLVYSNSRWRAMGPTALNLVVTPANTFIVDTDDPGIYPEVLTTILTLANGTNRVFWPVYDTASGVTATDIDIRPATTTFYRAILANGPVNSGAFVRITAITAAGVTDVANQGDVLVTLANQVRLFVPIPPP